MKLRLFSLLMLLLTIPATGIYTADTAYAATRKKSTRKSAAKNSRYTKYTGTVGKYKVTVFLDDNANGYYYYGNGSKGKLTLRGEYEGYGGGNFNHYYLYEYDSAGRQTAVWDVCIGAAWVDIGRYVKNINGDMTTNGKTYTVDLW